MGELKIKGLSAFQQIEEEEVMDMMLSFMVTDPRIVTHYVAFWRQEAKNEYATDEDKTRAEKMVKIWLKVAENQTIATGRFFTFEGIDSTVTESSSETNNVEQSVAPADVKLTVVKDDGIQADEDRILRVKYEKIIKKINVESLKQMCIELIKAGKNDEAKEVASFILGKGLFTGKKVKQWPIEKILNFLESCKEFKAPSLDPVAETTAPVKENEEVAPTEEVLNEETDLHKKYANFIGEHAPTLASLKVETKLSLKHGEIEKAMELAIFMLKEGLCSDSEKKWSDLEIEEWAKTIKQELIDDPDNLAGPQPVIDMMMKDFYPEIKNRILSTEVTEDEIKAYVINEVKTKNIENLIDFRTNATEEQFEKMYATYFLGFVANAYKDKANKDLDATEEIIKYIQHGIEREEKTFSSAVQSALILFKSKGEKVDLKEAKEIVYNIGKEKFPEQYAIAMEILDKTRSAVTEKKVVDKPVVIPAEETKIDFTKKYPQVWESIKDTNPQSLDDVYNMGRELEKSQSFLIVSEMIMYLIFSGKIKNKDGILINEDDNTMWDKAQIELWINTQFEKAETTAETESKVVNPTTAVTEPQAQTVGTEKETVVDVPSTKVEPEAVQSPIVDSKESTKESAIKESTPLIDPNTPNVTNDKDVKPFLLTSATILGTPGSYKIPDDKVPFTGLYAKSNGDFWHEFTNNILRLEKEGMAKKDIIHTMADVIKAIAVNDDLTQCHARNFKKTRIDEMYKVVQQKAAKYEIPGWSIDK